MSKKVTRSKTEYDVSLERREGKLVALIEAETSDVYEDGRGYAGQTVANRQVMIVPLRSLPGLSEAITNVLMYQVTYGLESPEDTYDLEKDAQRRIGLYSPLDPHTPVQTFYTVAEARVALQTCASGYALAHLPEEGESYRNVIEVKS